MNPTVPEITSLSTASLIPYARNARTHTEAQVQQIAASIREFGFTNPVLVKADRTIIAGHGRVQAAQLLGMESIPCLVLDYLSDTQAKALAIADNKIPLNSGWDAELLKLEMDELREAGVDMGLLAFGDGELEALLEVNPEKPNVVEDEFVPPEVVQTQIKPGDLIELGIHRLMCGDSTDAAEIGRLMGGAQADMVLTDPPYGVSYVGKTKDALKVENDELDEASLTKLVCDAFDNAEANCRAGAYWYATVPAGPLHILFADDWKRRGILRQIMVWAKDSMVLGHSEYHYQHEPILFGWIPGDRHKNSDRTRTTLWQYDRPKANREHPTMKPVALWAQAVTDGSRGGEVVYDPFLGSGTTLIAADQLGRKCYGMEISPQYCQVIVDRYKAHCEKSGKPFECKINGEAYEG